MIRRSSRKRRGLAAVFVASAAWGLLLPLVIASVLLRICRVRGREPAQWLILCVGSAVGTIGGAYYLANHGSHMVDIFTIGLEVGFPGVIAGFLSLPLAG